MEIRVFFHYSFLITKATGYPNVTAIALNFISIQRWVIILGGDSTNMASIKDTSKHLLEIEGILLLAYAE